MSELLARAAEVRLVCVGDLMLDRFVSGRIERISPEAPVPVLRVERSSLVPGGAGNVARNAAALGARVHLVGVVGDDEAGRELVSRLAADPRIEARPITDGARRTTVKTRFLAAGQQVLRADEETTAALSPAVRAAVLAAAEAAIATADVVLLSDYAKGVLAEGVAQQLIARGRAGGRPVVVDPKGRDFSPYRGASVLTPNRRELAEATGTTVTSPADAIAASRRLMGELGVDTIVATLGADGLVVVEAGAERHLPAVAREVFDVTGAGDTVVATLAVLRATGVPLAEAAPIANLAAGLVVGKVGTAVVTAAELTAALRHRELTAAEEKLCDAARAAEVAAAWRRRRLVVGFTNGCFDLIHPGHLSLLRQARAACDRLIVGLNSDRSVRRLKGEGRPVQPQAARALVLAALADVDLVVIFDEDTPAALIEAVQPDVLVKGADYRLEEVIGADFVRSYGGRVLLAELEPGYSTSKTLARLAGEGEGGVDQASARSTLPAR